MGEGSPCGVDPTPQGEGGGGQRIPFITLIPTFPPQGGRRLRVVNPIEKRNLA